MSPRNVEAARRGQRNHLLAVCFLTLGCAMAKPPPEPPPPKAIPAPAPAAAVVPEAPGTGQKFDGRVVTVRSQVPLIVFRIAFQAGSIDDPSGKEGLTTLTGRLMAEGGTLDLTSAQLLEALFPMAADIHVQTDKELTVFSGTVHPDHASRYVPLLLAALTRPRWDPKEFERLREDAVQDLEKRLRSGDDEALGKAALESLIWANHPYGHYEAGTVQGLRSLTLEDARRQAARLFTRDRMLIGVGGAVDDAIVSQLEQGLARLPQTSAELVPLPAQSLAETRVLLVQKQADSVAVSMGYPWALRRGHRDFHAMRIAVSALGEHRQFIGRLMRQLRVARGLNYGDYAYVEHFDQEGWGTFPLLNVGRRQQDFTVWLRPVPDENGLFAVRAALHEIDRFAREGISEQELETVRGFWRGYSLLLQQTPMRRLGYAMDDVYYGTDNDLEAFRRGLDSLTVAQVNDAIRKWIKPERLRIAMVAKDAPGLREAIVRNAPSPIRYVAEKPDPAILAEDEKIVSRPLNVTGQQVVVKPVEQLFER